MTVVIAFHFACFCTGWTAMEVVDAIRTREGVGRKIVWCGTYTLIAVLLGVAA